jgi:UDP-glucose 4-epimerase
MELCVVGLGKIGLPIAVQAAGSDQTVVYAPRSDATLVTNRIGCPELARQEINFQASIGLEQGLASLIAWRDADRDLSG